MRPVVLRGEFMKSIANAEFTGVPIDANLYHMMRTRWPELQDKVVARVNVDIPVFRGRHFKQDLFRNWLEPLGLLKGWPATPRSGRLVTDDATLRQKAALHPALEPLRQVIQMLNQMHELKLSVGSDGRNRCVLSPYATKTSRCAPSSSRFIFNAPSFLRGLIKPEPGRALVLVDWVAQEFGVAAALSKDPVMWHAYESVTCIWLWASCLAQCHSMRQKRATPENGLSSRLFFSQCNTGLPRLVWRPASNARCPRQRTCWRGRVRSSIASGNGPMP